MNIIKMTQHILSDFETFLQRIKELIRMRSIIQVPQLVPPITAREEDQNDVIVLQVAMQVFQIDGYAKLVRVGD